MQRWNPDNNGPPHDKLAEAELIGSLLLDSSVRPAVFELLKPADFYYDSHRAIYSAILQMIDEGKRVDWITVVGMLKQRGQLDAAGGEIYLRGLAETIPYTGAAYDYAEVIHSNALRRRLAVAGQTIMGMAYAPDLGTDEVMEMAEQEVHRISRASLARDAVMTADLTESEQDYDSWRSGKPDGIPTGIDALDMMLAAGGMTTGELIVIGADTSMGKTSLATGIALEVSRSRRVVFFSIEMKKEAIMQRLWAVHGWLNTVQIQRRALSELEYLNLQRVKRAVAQLPICIDDNSSIGVSQMRSLVRRQQAKGDVGLVVIDHLQEMHYGTAEKESVAIKELVKGIKGLAKELNVPTILLSQLRRRESNKRPTRADLYGTSAIEQSADVIGLLFSKDMAWDKDSQRRKRYVTLGIDKQRNGPKGDIQLVYYPHSTRFECVETNEEEEEMQ